MKPQTEMEAISQDSSHSPFYDLVSEFHRHFGFSTNRLLNREGFYTKAVTPQGQKINVSQTLFAIANSLSKTAEQLLPIGTAFSKELGDNRAYRAHLMIEELGEVLQALAERDPIMLTDALADLVYVVIGTAVTYGIPMTAAFEEVHRSNMTKSRSEDDYRMKKKDPALGYSPPDIAQVLIDSSHYIVGELK